MELLRGGVTAKAALLKEVSVMAGCGVGLGDAGVIGRRAERSRRDTRTSGCWVVAVGSCSHVRGRAGRCRPGTVVDGPYFRISREPITAALRRAAATKFAGPEPGGGTE